LRGGKRAVGDKGFDADTFRATLHWHGARICIVRFNRGYCRHRHRVENFFGRIKRFRRISTRYD
jgi:transposase